MRINNKNHTHDENEKSSHTIIRRFKKTSEILICIKIQAEKNNAFKNILNYIKKHFDNDDLNKFVFKIFDIYNELNKIRSKKLSNKTFIQALNVQLQNNSKYWTRVMLNLMTNEVKYLFWINEFFMNMLKINDEINILNCIYKTNRHNMSLTILTNVIDLNISF